MSYAGVVINYVYYYFEDYQQFSISFSFGDDIYTVSQWDGQGQFILCKGLVIDVLCINGYVCDGSFSKWEVNMLRS